VDIQPTTTQPISDDQELAKALAGIADDPIADIPAPAPLVEPSAVPDPSPVMPPVAEPAPAVVEPLPTPTVAAPVAPSSDLTGVKELALNELRPLIDKVELPAEEKFDAYLMLIRSTDDASLVQPAHAAAQAITDEKRKAEALLDIIKEIDFLSNPQK
jgi:hypothetical protein